MANLADQAAYYDKRWGSFQYANLFGLERCIFILQALCDLELKEPSICDLGCGTGWLSSILATFGPTTGVELSPKAVELAQQFYPTAKFMCADATHWEPAAGSFDVVVSQEVIEHIEDKRAYLDVIYRALRPGGYLLMTTPNLDVLNAIPSAERKATWEIQPLELPLNRTELNALLSDSGFRVLRGSSVVTGCGKLGLQRLLNSYKLEKLLAVLQLARAWKSFLRNRSYGMYLTTVAQKPRKSAMAVTEAARRAHE